MNQLRTSIALSSRPEPETVRPSLEWLLFRAENPDFVFDDSDSSRGGGIKPGSRQISFDDPLDRKGGQVAAELKKISSVPKPNFIQKSQQYLAPSKLSPLSQIKSPIEFSNIIESQPSLKSSYDLSILHPEVLPLKIFKPIQQNKQNLAEVGRMMMQGVQTPNRIEKININPLLGGSEGQQRHQLYNKNYIDYANSNKQGSLNDNRLAFKREKILQLQIQKPDSVSLVDKIMQSPTKVQLLQSQRSENFIQPPDSNMKRKLQQEQSVKDIERDQKILQEKKESDFNSAKKKAQAYKEILLQQINEAQQRKNLEKLKQAEQDVLDVNLYSKSYKYGNQQGGGAPMRDQSGHIITQHPSVVKSQFNSQSAENIEQHIEHSAEKSFSPNHSPTKQEMVHMRPSNKFAEITEDQFNRREAEKNLYRLELQKQMDSARLKRDFEKQRQQIEEWNEEQKILADLKAMNSDEKSNKKEKQLLPDFRTPSPKIKKMTQNLDNINPESKSLIKGNRDSKTSEIIFEAQSQNQKKRNELVQDTLSKLQSLQEEINQKNQAYKDQTQKMLNEILTTPGSTRQPQNAINHQQVYFKHDSIFEKLMEEQNSRFFI